MARRLKEQLTGGIQWIRGRARNNPLGLFVAVVFVVLFILTLWIPAWAARLGFDNKMFWDWMELLLVPLALAAAGYWLSRTQKQAELEAAEKAREKDREIAARARETDTEIALVKHH